MCFNQEKIYEFFFIGYSGKQRILEDNETFFTNKGCLYNSDIMLRGDIEMIIDENRLAKLFSEHQINIVERSIGLKPEK